MSTELDSRRSQSSFHDDEDDGWIPLVAEDEPETRVNRRSASVGSSSSTSLYRRVVNPKTSITRRESLESIQQRLESRKRLREGLVEHPLNRFYRRFLVHFAGELWNQDPHVRVGLILVAVGSVLQFFVLLSSLFSCWYFCFRPKLFFVLSLLVVSYIYLANIDIGNEVQAVITFLSTPSALVDKTCQFFDRFQLRWLLLFFLLVPAFLEAKTLAFLSGTLARSGWILNCTASLLCATWMFYQFRVTKVTPRECTVQGLIVLYGSALLAATTVLDIRRIHVLGGPFLIATGSLLLSYQQDESRLSRAVRHALRLSLRDVLATLGETVQEDEMLQLAMIRWIVDYWSYAPPSAPSNVPSTPSAPENQANQQRVDSSTTSQLVQASSMQHELEWSELFSMLTMTTDQMEVEIHPSLSSPAEPQQSQSIPPPTAPPDSNGSLANLKNMLASMNVDEHAKPAVMSYKQAVEGFPPSRRVAECLALIRRCPAAMALFFLYGFGSPLALPSTVALVPFILFEVLRVQKWANACRRAYGATTAETEPTGDITSASPLSSILSLPSEMDSMSIFLSEDNHSSFRHAPLLQVWANVHSSVSALETGLTAARCVHTTAVAADFAGNIMSLAQFGVEVSQKGWLHGVAIMLQELIHMHAASGQTEHGRSADMATNTRYTSAAVNALKNGNVMAHNVGVLLEEAGGNPAVEVVVGFLTALVGRGWLWGMDDSTESPNVTRTSENEDHDQETSDNEIVHKAKPAPRHSDSSVGGKNSTGKESEKILKESTCPPKEADEGSVSDNISIEQNLASAEPTSMEDRQELSHVLEQLADAYERGLIVENEKDAFILMLADSGDGTKTRRNINVVRTSLECVFKEAALHSEHEVDTETSREQPVSLDQTDKNKKQPEQRMAAVSQSLEAEDDEGGQNPTSEGCGPIAQRKLAHPSIDCESSSDSSGRQKSDRVSNESVPIADDADGSGVNDKTTQMVTRTSASAALRDCQGQTTFRDEPHATSAPDHCETNSSANEGDHWLKLAGMGLGVVGAVIGGLAVASHASKTNENSNASEREGSQRERATPYIEEIVDDETDTHDEWESVSASNSNVE